MLQRLMFWCCMSACCGVWDVEGGAVRREGIVGEEEGGDFGVVDATFVVASVGWEALGSCNDWEGGGVWPGGVNGDMEWLGGSLG